MLHLSLSFQLILFRRLATEPPEPVVDVHPGFRQREAAVPRSAARAGKVEKVGHGKNSNFLSCFLFQEKKNKFLPCPLPRQIPKLLV